MDEDSGSSAREQYVALRRKFKAQQNEYRKLIQQYDLTRKTVKTLMRERNFLQDKLAVLSSRSKTKDVTKKRPKVELPREEPVTPTNFIVPGL